MSDEAKTPAVPLPPPEVLTEMLKTEPTAAPKAAPVAAEKLSFIGGTPWSKTIPLDFPFEWEGRDVLAITVHRFTAEEMGAVVDEFGTNFTRWDLIAAMCGYPVKVLRGLEAGDADAVMEAGIAFFPKALAG